jgi:hypothetical protein
MNVPLRDADIGVSRYLKLIAKHHKLSSTAAKYVFDLARFNPDTLEEGTSSEESELSKEGKELNDSEDYEECDEQKGGSRKHEEAERHKGISGARIDSKRSEGKTRVANSAENGGERQRLKAQLALLNRRHRS